MCVEKCTKGTRCLSGEVGHLGQRAKVLVGKGKRGVIKKGGEYVHKKKARKKRKFV